MFDLDAWQEIFSTMRKNLLRTILTGFSVSWGIFMLIILLGSGRGLENAAKSSFNRGAVNSLWVFPGSTSMSYKGMKPGRELQFHDRDYEETKRKNDEIEHITSRFTIVFNTILSYKNKTAEYEIQSARETDMFVEQMEILEGRFINIRDIEKSRKVAVISPIVRDYFFGEEDPMGKYIIANGIAFKVVGIFKDASERNHYRIYIPTTTAQNLYNGRNNVSYLGLTIKPMSVQGARDFEDKLRTQFAERHKFNPEDSRAMFINNNWEYYNQMLNIFLGIKIFIWIIGILSIIAAIVGVINIMLITVKERTKEIGVRKAIGATPGSVIRMVIFESLIITSFFGYLGLFFGTAIIELVSNLIPPNEMFNRPEVSLPTAIGATLLLIAFGTLAGYFPARNAANIKPIEALHDE
ncbi:MAG: ABC transporter permease [Bacteroidales bacterium]|nr:ABC transporter permease [Bacteroidales bacterium]